MAWGSVSPLPKKKKRKGENSGSVLENDFLISTEPQVSLLCYNNKYVLLGSFLYNCVFSLI